MKKKKTKKWYSSRTFWANILSIVGGVAFAISGELSAGGILTTAGVVNIVLRVVSKHEITF